MMMSTERLIIMGNAMSQMIGAACGNQEVCCQNQLSDMAWDGVGKLLSRRLSQCQCESQLNPIVRDVGLILIAVSEHKPIDSLENLLSAVVDIAGGKPPRK